MKIADDVADQLAKSHQQVLDALVDGDRETRRLVADDCQIVGPKGFLIGKEEWIDAYHSGVYDQVIHPGPVPGPQRLGACGRHVAAGRNPVHRRRASSRTSPVTGPPGSRVWCSTSPAGRSSPGEPTRVAARTHLPRSPTVRPLLG